MTLVASIMQPLVVITEAGTAEEGFEEARSTTRYRWFNSSNALS